MGQKSVVNPPPTPKIWYEQTPDGRWAVMERDVRGRISEVGRMPSQYLIQDIATMLQKRLEQAERLRAAAHVS